MPPLQEAATSQLQAMVATKERARVASFCSLSRENRNLLFVGEISRLVNVGDSST